MKPRFIKLLVALVAVLSVGLAAEAQTNRTNKQTLKPQPARAGTDAKAGYTDPRLTAITNELRMLPAQIAVAKAEVEATRITKKNLRTDAKAAKLAEDKLAALEARRAKLLAEAQVIKAQRTKFGH